MLSFMREHGPEDSPRPSEERAERRDSSAKELAVSSRVPANSAEESEEQGDAQRQQRRANGKSQMANGGGDACLSEGLAEEYLTVSTRNKNARRSTMLLGVLFGIGLLCLWFMIKKSTPRTAEGAVVSNEEAQIEMAITQLTGVRSEMFNRMDEIVKKFYEFSDVRQVKVNELVKNPFEQEIFLVNVQEISDNKEGDFDPDSEMIRWQQMRERTEGMQLMSLMKSDAGNCCMIDERILYEGDTIKGFKVIQISDSFVKLEWDPELDEGSLGAESEGVEIILKLLE